MISIWSFVSYLLTILCVAGAPVVAADAGQNVGGIVNQILNQRNHPQPVKPGKVNPEPVLAHIDEIIAAQRKLIVELPQRNREIQAYNAALDNLSTIGEYLKVSNPDLRLDRQQKAKAIEAIQKLPPVNRAEFKRELERLQYFGGDIAAKAVSLLLALDGDPPITPRSGLVPHRFAPHKDLLTEEPYRTAIAQVQQVAEAHKACPAPKVFQGWLDTIDKQEKMVQKQIDDLQKKVDAADKASTAANAAYEKARMEYETASYELLPRDSSSLYDSDYRNRYERDLQDVERKFSSLNYQAGDFIRHIFFGTDEQYDLAYGIKHDVVERMTSDLVGTGDDRLQTDNYVLGLSKVGKAPATNPMWTPSAAQAMDKSLGLAGFADLNDSKYQRFFVQKIGSETDRDFRYQLTPEGQREVTKLFQTLHQQYLDQGDSHYYDRVDVKSIQLNRLSELDDLRHQATEAQKTRPAAQKKLDDHLKPESVAALKKAYAARKKAEEDLARNNSYELGQQLSMLKDKNLKMVQASHEKVAALRRQCASADDQVLGLDTHKPDRDVIHSAQQTYEDAGREAQSREFTAVVNPGTHN